MAAQGGGGRRPAKPYKAPTPGNPGKRMPGKAGLTNRRFGPTGRPVPVGSGPRTEDGTRRTHGGGGKKRK